MTFTIRQGKRWYVFSLVIAFIYLSGCDFRESKSKDFATEALTRGSGLACNDIVMEINGKPEKRNIYEYGEKLELIFNEFEGFKLKDGKYFPILSALVLKNGKDTALFSKNLLEEFKEGTDLNPLQLNAFFRMAFPYQNNESYELNILIKDAIGEGEFSYVQPFTVVENDLLTVSATGYSYSNVYLWNQTEDAGVFLKAMDMSDHYALMLEGLQDVRRFGETVYPVLSVDIRDANGMVILSDNNLLIHYEKSGVLYEDVFLEKLPVTVSFNEGIVNNPCSLNLVLYEPGTNRKLEVSGEIVLE
jgi:hypothetical protein